MALTLPDDFYATHWQKSPVFLPAASTVAALAPSPEQLWDWARDSHHARLIRPLADFAVDLEPDHPPSECHTLLVGHVETHSPTLAAWAAALPALGRWRFADLMISHAMAGASVGAHRDQYDVFLIQIRGQRQWDVGTLADRALPEINTGGSKLLDGFTADFTVTATPGDLLYIPPGCGHRGVALDDECMTLSVGFRMPSVFDVLERLNEVAPAPLLTDATRTGAPGNTLCGVEVREQLLSWIQQAPAHELSLAFGLAATQLGEPTDPTELSQHMGFAPGVRAVWVEGELIIQGEAFIGLDHASYQALCTPDGLATEGLSGEAIAILETFAEEGWLVSI